MASEMTTIDVQELCQDEALKGGPQTYFETYSPKTLQDNIEESPMLSDKEAIEPESFVDFDGSIVDSMNDGEYSCNTCGVSFSSVAEHIRKYHFHEDVVIETEKQESLDDFVTYLEIDSEEKKDDKYEVIKISGDDLAFIDMSNIQFVNEDEEFKSDSTEIVCDPVVENETYKCSICEEDFISSRSLCAHMKIHKQRNHTTPKEPKKRLVEQFTFKCDECTTYFPTNKSLQLHKKMHETKKPPPAIILVNGLRNKDEKINVYQCTVCSRLIHADFRSIHDATHETERYNCQKCNKMFYTLEDYEMHLKAHNSESTVPIRVKDELKYPCNYCQRKFARPYEKVKHERIHTGEKPYSCEICGKKFRESYCRILHLRTHTGDRPYTCQYCGKKFKSSSVYNFHLLIHSDARNYKCNMCPKTFKTPVQLAGHKNSHIKPFHCNKCNRPFASLHAVRIHSLIHKKENNLKFTCQLCGANYARSYALRDHMKRLHAVEEILDGELHLATESIIQNVIQN